MPKPFVHSDPITEMMFGAAFADIEEIRQQMQLFFQPQGTQQQAQQALLEGGSKGEVLLNTSPDSTRNKTNWDWSKSGVPIGPFTVGKSFVGAGDYVS